MIRRLSAIVILLSALVCAKDSKDEGFSGRWVLETKNSSAPAEIKDLEEKIKLSGSKITIESKFSEPSNGILPLLYLGVLTNALTLNTDGSDTQNQVGPFQMASKTTNNENELVTDWTAESKGDQVTGHWTRTLSDDGRHMVLKIQESSSQGRQAEAELHFTRK